ncbi:MAG: BCCT family transporter, partial [Myxococcales bacterium]|nr:BCCT family transporter [Myxococcales bacterium]
FFCNALVENLGAYLQRLPINSFWTGTFEDAAGKKWLGEWTVFYWGWWIAWSPFVGMFIARISKGRTLREFILGVMLVPTLVAFLWLTVFGNTALHLEMTGKAEIAQAVDNDVSTAIYVMLRQLPWAGLTSFLAAATVTVFFVTSSDSGSLVVDMLTSGGHPNPPRWQRVFWASAEGGCAAVLLYAGGSQALKALQSVVICVGLPFCVVLLVMCASLVRGLASERSKPIGAGRPEPASLDNLPT